MTLALLFWILFILWVALGVYRHRSDWSGGAGDLLLAALIFVIGWSEFGFIVRG